MKLHVLGLDLGKTVFHLVALDSTGRVVIRKRCSRTQLLAFTANLQVQLIGMESCSGSHFLGRASREQGHQVRRVVFRVLWAQLQVELGQLTARMEQMDRVIQETAKDNEACQRLTEIPGVGPVTATTLIAAVGHGSAFRKGRDLSARIGIVPRECSTGGQLYRGKDKGFCSC
jgi:transposase